MSQQLIRALQDAALYDHPVTQFELVETHISWVILTGPYAYKIKKPNNFGFLDFSTLEKRKHFCGEELRLNRRLAPELYQEVITITGDDTEPKLGGDGGVFEYAIKMRQFDQDQLLDRVLTRNELQSHHIEEIASLVADFHQRIEIADPKSRFGVAQQVIEPIQQNFEQIRPFLQDAADLEQLAHLEAWAMDTYALLQQSLTERKQQGFIRECHGDLHLGNITIVDGTVTLFDCIEFNDDFRWIDVISEVAFFCMDLEARGQQRFANLFLNAYLELTGDYASLKLLNFYKAYRALVRAKVTLLRLHDAAPEATGQIFSDYRRYADLAQTYMRIPHCFLILMHGYSGTGKTTVSSGLVEKLGAIRLRSDVIRKKLFAAASETSDSEAIAAINEGIYSHAASAKTLEHLAQLAAQILATGHPVIADATFLQSGYRSLLAGVSEKLGTPLQLISCELPDEIVRTRLKERALQATDPSDADIEVYEAQLSQAEPLNGEELGYTLVVDTSSEETINTFVDHFARGFIV